MLSHSFSSSRWEVALCSGFIDGKSPGSAGWAGREGGGLRLEQVSTWTFLGVLDFQCTRNPREEALLHPLMENASWGSRGAVGTPDTAGPFSRGAREEESGQRKLPYRWPSARENAAASLESSGAWGLGAFPCYFLGKPREGCVNSCWERQRNQPRAVGWVRR